MRSTIITVLLFMLLTPCMAQSESTEDRYLVGDTLLLATDRLPSNRRIAAPTSGNYWNFRSLQAPFTRMVIVRSNKSARIEADYIITEVEGVDYYIDDRADGQWITGMKIRLMDGDMVGVVAGDMPYRLDNATEGDTASFSGRIIFSRNLEFEPGALEFADSLRIVVNWSHKLTRDMDGRIDIESGVYDAMRSSTVKSVDFVTEAKVRGEWVRMDDTNLNYLPPQLREGITYTWWADEVAQPLAYVVADKYGSAQSVTFRASPLAGRRKMDDLPSTPDIFVHPNPTFGFVRFELVNLPADTYTIEIYNIIGVKIRTFQIEVNGRLTLPYDFSDLKRGTYIYRLVNSSMKTIRSKRLVIIQP